MWIDGQLYKDGIHARPPLPRRPARRCVELFLDMLPRRFFPVIFRQVLH
jgi:hypothetical protein